MSDNWITFIPTDPHWVGDDAAAERAAKVVAELAPEAEEIEALQMDEVEFFDAGQNFESAKCPHCGADVTEWWPEAMDRGHEIGFSDLSTTMPCCGRPASLNDLVYKMPQGFAQFAIAVMNPNIEEVDGAAVRRVGEALGHPVRVIYQRI
jgi:hypothetical protein